MEMGRPDFLPVTVMLISRDRDRRFFRASFPAGCAGLVLMAISFTSGGIDGQDFSFDVIARGVDSNLMPAGIVMLPSPGLLRSARWPVWRTAATQTAKSR